MQHYIYDGSGERVLKANSDMEAVYENGELVNAPGTVSINGYTSYPSAFMVITADGVYSKHYYAGAQRIVSRLGDNDASIFEINYRNYTQATTENTFEDQKLQLAQIEDLNHYAEKAQKGKVTLKEYKPIPLEEQEKAMAENVGSEVERIAAVPPIYYYHPDHLGTSTALTDFNGNAYQFFLNLPFGETMAQQLGSNYYNSPFKFNGKELDEETGFYYYGARYYDPKISIWLSVDPLAEQAPGWSPYNYCLNNPINLIDPDGRDPRDPPKNGVRIVLNLGGHGAINAAAETHLKNLQNIFTHDKIIYITDNNLGNLKSNVAKELAQAKKDGYGETLELSVFSHNGADGPKGGYYEDNAKDLSKEPGMTTFERGQMSKENWGDVDFNFNKDNSIATFYGCNSASWAEQFFSMNKEVKFAAGIAGKAGPLNYVKGDADRSMFYVGSVYLRAVDEDNDQVLPMFLYQRGTNTEKEVYSNPTVPSYPKTE